MGEELAGAATTLVLVLAYLLIVQAMMAACVLLAEFTVLRLRQLGALFPRLVDHGESATGPSEEVEAPSHPSYRIGGHVRW